MCLMESVPNILAVETSARIGSVALAQGEHVKCAESFRADFNHAVELLPTIARLCESEGWSIADLDHVYLSIGPGSFTGLRIAVTLARTLALSAELKIVTVPTVDVIAQNALEVDPPPPNLAVVLDAKRGQIYAASFRRHNGKYDKTVDACVADAADFLRPLPQPLFLIGEGLEYHAEALRTIAHEQLPADLWRPRAEAVHRLGWDLARGNHFTAPTDVMPVYLRLPEAEEVWRKKHGQSS